MLNHIAPFAVQSGEGKMLVTPTGDVVTIKATTSQTNGSLTVLELVFGPKQGPALHTHLREDELWYVIEGEFRFTSGDARLRTSTGGMAFGPRGTPHCFENIGDTPGRLLVICTPSGLERLFEDWAALLPDQIGPETLAAVGHTNWIEFVGPSAAKSDPL
jgi:mannose-6-phosphate isomerase-like protein (cupin superfamily)